MDATAIATSLSRPGFRCCCGVSVTYVPIKAARRSFMFIHGVLDLPTCAMSLLSYRHKCQLLEKQNYQAPVVLPVGVCHTFSRVTAVFKKMQKREKVVTVCTWYSLT